MLKIPFQYNFRPVGQGLFSTGMVGRPDTFDPEDVLFNWVYDCGSSDSPKALSREVRQYVHSLRRRQLIDFFVVSHLDIDHINGVADISKDVHIKWLFLPYVPMVDRIEIALRAKDVSADAIRLAIDPGGYLTELGGDNLGSIVFVVSGDGEGPVPGGGSPEPPRSGPEEKEEEWPEFKKVNSPPGDAFRGEFRVTGSKVQEYYIRSDSPVTVKGLWEFVFFNEDYPEADVGFRASVEQRIQQSRRSNGSLDDPDTLIADLKRLYESQFTSRGKRNNISLVTYSGPVEQKWIRRKRCSGAYIYPCSPNNRCSPSRFRFLGPHRTFGNMVAASILYFGDISLTQSRLVGIQRHFGIDRWRRLHPVQIAHHGAKGSWFASASKNFWHQASVYSYGLHNSYQHPGKDVVADFQSMSQTVLVNEHQGAVWFGNLVIQ